MTIHEEEFLKKLRKTFRAEADDHIRVISAGLIELEKLPEPVHGKETIEVIFRESHSLKGAARAVGQVEIEMICRSLENIFAGLKRNAFALSQNMFDPLLQATDLLSQLSHALEHPPSAEEMARTKAGAESVVAKLETLLHGNDSSGSAEKVTPGIHAPLKSIVADSMTGQAGQTVSQVPVAPPVHEKSRVAETIRIPEKKLDAILRQTEELISMRLSMTESVQKIQNLAATLEQWRRDWSRISGSVRIRERELQRSWAEEKDSPGNPSRRTHTTRILDYLWRNEHFIKSMEREIADLDKTGRQDHYNLGLMTERLQEEVKKLLLFPFSSILEAFPKIVRDLSRDRGKQIDLEVRGGFIEIDKRILEFIKDPLMHLVRNCVDHGIETPEIRKMCNKNPRGTITIAISHPDSSNVEIVVSDDGAGIDTGVLKTTAINKGLISAEEAALMSEDQALSLILQSGFTTAELITDISGRGLGMAILREKVENLGGIIRIETNPGTGAAFRILIPVAFSSIHGIFIRLAGEIYIFPSALVERVCRVGSDEIRTAANKECITLDDKTVPVVRLAGMLQVPNRQEEIAENQRFLNLVVIAHGDNRTAYLVDEISGSQDVLVKVLGKQIPRVEFISAVTILGSGSIVPILNVYDLVRASDSPASRITQALPVHSSSTVKPAVLVAEDSITSRTLLKNILEGAGYDVTTAVDGFDAFSKLRARQYNILISDVDMPRMSGFDLIAKIRADKKLADIPAILVTSLGSREDRERGIDVGANAYIVKSGFEQNDLLEAIRQLI